MPTTTSPTELRKLIERSQELDRRIHHLQSIIRGLRQEMASTPREPLRISPSQRPRAANAQQE